MKSTDIERIDRELRKARKKEEMLEKRVRKEAMTVGDYIKKLYSLLYHDDKRIYNLKDNRDIQALFATMKQEIPEKQWDNVLRKALKETRVPAPQREEALRELSRVLAAAR